MLQEKLQFESGVKESRWCDEIVRDDTLTELAFFQVSVNTIMFVDDV